MMDKKSNRISFAAVSPFLDGEPRDARETKSSRHDYITWGSDNAYPNYLAELYESCTTLRTIIGGVVEFACGNDVIFRDGQAVNRKGQTSSEVVRALALNAALYGGFALQVIRTRDGKGVAEVYPIDLRHLRCNKERTVFYYSEEWGERYRRFDKVDVYPAFEVGGSHPTSILLIRFDGLGVYPSPCYASAVKDCEIERKIDDFHMAALDNGFASSYIINFNNGETDDELKAEVERGIAEKFAGYQNAGRPMVCWNRDKESAVTLSELKVEDFGVKYEALAKHSRQQIFAAFRAIPSLFGIMTESTGFSEQEFSEAFKLFNRTKIKPVQTVIVDAFAKIYGEDVLTIVPFSLETETEGVI